MASHPADHDDNVARNAAALAAAGRGKLQHHPGPGLPKALLRVAQVWWSVGDAFAGGTRNTRVFAQCRMRTCSIRVTGVFW